MSWKEQLYLDIKQKTIMSFLKMRNNENQTDCVKEKRLGKKDQESKFIYVSTYLPNPSIYPYYIITGGGTDSEEST